MTKIWEHYKRLTIALLIGLLTFWLVKSTFCLLKKYRNHPAWSLIPADAVAVFEIQDAVTQWQNLRNSAAWEQIRQIPFFRQWHQQATRLDGAARDDSLLLGKQTIYVSLHITAKNDFDAVFYIPAEAPTENILEKLQHLFIDFQPTVKETRIYQGENLYELTSQSRNRVFTFLLADNYWVGSFTPYLIEDVVRTYNSLGRNNFQSAHASLFTARQLMADMPVRLYLNFEKLKDWTGIFAEIDDMAMLTHMTDDLLLGLEIRKNSLQWVGVTANTKKNQLTYFLKDNPPVSPQSIADKVPSETAYLYCLGAADGRRLYRQLRQYWAVHQPLLLNAMDSLADKTNLDTEAFYELLKGEIALAVSELSVEGMADRWVIMSAKDSRKALRLLEQAAKKILPTPQDTLFNERYGKLRIVQLPLPELPRLLFGEGFGGFSQVFVAANGRHLIFSNGLAGMKRYADDIDKGNTWAAPEKQYLFNGMDSTSHISLIVNHKRNWSRQQSYMHAEVEKNALAQLRRWLFFTHFGLELSGKPQGHFSAKVVIGHSEQRNINTGEAVKLWELDIGSPLREQPQLVINHNNRSVELIFQDQNNNLHLVAANGRKLWTLPMSTAVTSGYPQIDYFNNGKLQYLLTTTQAIYLIDRLGRVVSGFPIKHDWGGMVDQLGVIDYDNTKDYRLAPATNNGNIFLLNKSGQLLQGWTPRKTAGALIVPLRHIRTQSKDCMLVLQEKGVMLMKRNGESYPGFPVLLPQEIYPAMIVESGTDLANYCVRVLTKTGDLLKINFKGQILSREQYYEDNGGGQFTFCIDPSSSNRWIITRQVNNILTGSGINGKLLFRISLADDSYHLVQFFGFGAGADVVAITNTESGTCKLYLTNGDTLTREPIPTRLPVAVRLDEQRQVLQVFAGHQNKLQAWEVAL
jgi:hypothetical protein